ncbi:zinc-ribbon domain-containing protein, partial [Corynebacterium casei]|uniref:zinc-ribbon domain-containing protein n=1 Tax=Corynebacterium casei TaxID=160386 RepID=UPI003FCFF778
MAGSEKRGFWLCAMCRCSLESKIYSVMHGRHHCWKCGVKVRSEQKKKAPFERSLSFLRPDLLEEWDEKRNAELGLFPDAVFAQSHSRANWNCKTCGHIWETKIQSRFLGGGCPKCRRTPSKKIGVTDRVQSKS